MDFLDVNVWVAIAVEAHPDKESAERYWKEEASPLVTTDISLLMGVCRVLSGPGAGPTRTSPRAAWEYVREIMRLPTVRLLDPTEATFAALDRIMDSGCVTHRLCTDAYLAAVAISHGLRLVTFDGDFDRFPDLNLLRLSS